MALGNQDLDSQGSRDNNRLDADLEVIATAFVTFFASASLVWADVHSESNGVRGFGGILLAERATCAF